MHRMIKRIIVSIFLVWVMAASLAGAEAWTLNYERAKARAKTSGKPILVLFTGSDWCPPCKQFERDVAHSDRFLSHVNGRVVLLKLDFPQNMLQAPELIAQNEALAQRIGGEEYPRFYLLDERGEVLAKLNMRVPRRATDYTDFILQALDEALAATHAANASR